MSSTKRAKKLNQRAQTLDSSRDLLLLNYPVCSSATPANNGSIQSTSTSNMLMSYEKVLNDAFLTGNLNLCSRQIKEFPVPYTQRYDITDLVNADLSNNCFCEFPLCVCEWRSLETLKLCSNNLRSIPNTISSLSSLTFLDMGNNHLTQLPPSLFTLPLKILILAGNRLESLSADVKQLGATLQELDLKSNRLRQLPAATALLTELRVLNLRSNQLKDLPGEIGCLGLRILDITDNLLIRLPIELHKLEDTCLRLSADGNPLMEPPISIVRRGSAHTFKWLSTRAEQQLGSHQASHSFADLNPVESQNAHGTLYNFNNFMDFSRTTNLNATIRRSDRASLARNIESQRRPERRSRSIKAAYVIDAAPSGTFCGTDSGYITGDDQKKNEPRSTHVTLNRMNGNFALIDEQPSISTLDERIKEGGELAREILRTFEQTKLNSDNLHSTTKQQTSLRVNGLHDDLHNPPDEGRPPALRFAVNSAHLSATIKINNHRQNDCLSPVVESSESMKTSGYPGAKNSKDDRMNASNASIDSTTSSQVTILNGQGVQSNQQVLSTVQNRTPNLHHSTVASDRTSGSKTQQCSRTINGSPKKPPIQLNGETKKPNNISSSNQSIGANNLTKRTKVSGAMSIKTSAKSSSTVPTSSNQQQISRKSPPINNVQRRPSVITNPKSATTKKLASSTLSLTEATKPISNRLMAKSMSAKVQPATNGVPGKVQAFPSSKTKPPPSSVMSSSAVVTRSQVNRQFKKAGSVDPSRTSKTTSNNSRLNASSVNLDASKKKDSEANGGNSPTNTSIDLIHKHLSKTLKDLKLGESEQQLAQQLADGVLLCSFLNALKAGLVPTVIRPSSLHTLSVTRARRNVENFVSACRELGVPETSMCHPSDILERKNLQATSRTICFLAKKLQIQA